MAYDADVEILDRNNAVQKIAAVVRDTRKASVIELGFGGSLADDDNPVPVVDLSVKEAALGDNIMELPVPGLSAWVETTKDYSATVAGDAIWTPSSGTIYVVRQVAIEWYGANDGNVFVWGSASAAADTAYTANTDRLISSAHPTPSTKGNGGRDRQGLWVGVGAQYPVRVTITNNLNCTVSLGGWLYTL